MEQLTPAPAVDWSGVFLALRREGYTMGDVSHYAQIPRATMIGWAQGAEPRHQDGETVIKFWSEVMQLPREALPTLESNRAGSRLGQARA
ncbi:hypothetical protein D0839_16335 [Bordetella avium]|nr:hypothetical protein D0432_16350 [Bordetella avium]RIQ44922.1 hypothetical protein D0845_17090 [Bordetella avium]RIQ49572.1 hypothetical protein D0844_16385 [Bordetella avium]RIQ55331.1 hypothetical protein D0841_16565 [Bordetella avium]RIQ58417.1 hypothetical protein D0842_16480 [Bordetella avium]